MRPEIGAAWGGHDQYYGLCYGKEQLKTMEATAGCEQRIDLTIAVVVQPRHRHQNSSKTVSIIQRLRE